MDLFLVTIPLFLLSWLPTCLCADWLPFLHAPSAVLANTLFRCNFSEFSVFSGDATYVDHIQIFLIASPNAQSTSADFFNSICSLNTTISICDPSITVGYNHIKYHNTTFTVTIPNNVGPPGPYYALSAIIINADGSEYDGGTFSDPFNLSGTTGNFSRIDYLDYTLATPNGYFPCTSIACVRACADKSVNASSTDTGPYEVCVNQCPGLTVDWGTSSTSSTSMETGLITFTGDETVPTVTYPTPTACVYPTTSQFIPTDFLPSATIATSTSSSSTANSAAPAIRGVPAVWMLLAGVLAAAYNPVQIV